jgi:AcrR family transcriptional regulator
MPGRKTIADDDILTVARSFFLRDGINASTRTIAEEAGISEAVIFQRFGTKNNLFFAAMVPPKADLDSIFMNQPGKGSVVGNIERIALRLFDYFQQVMPVFVSLISHPSFDVQEFLKTHHLPFMQVVERLSEYLSAEAELGRVRKGSLPAATEVLISHVHNLALLESVGGHGHADARRAVHDAVAVLWNGIRPEAAK